MGKVKRLKRLVGYAAALAARTAGAITETEVKRHWLRLAGRDKRATQKRWARMVAPVEVPR